MPAAIVSLTGDERDRLYAEGLVDSPLRTSHRKIEAPVEVEGREDAELH